MYNVSLNNGLNIFFCLTGITTVSSTCLAGSHLNLPLHKPYSAHDSEVLSDLDEIPEREHAYIDYTDENPHVSMVTEDKLFHKNDNGKKISFSDAVVAEEVKRMGLEVSSDSESIDDDQNESSTELGSDKFCGDDVMEVDKIFDRDVDN